MKSSSYSLYNKNIKIKKPNLSKTSILRENNDINPENKLTKLTDDLNIYMNSNSDSKNSHLKSNWIDFYKAMLFDKTQQVSLSEINLRLKLVLDKKIDINSSKPLQSSLNKKPQYVSTLINCLNNNERDYLNGEITLNKLQNIKSKNSKNNIVIGTKRNTNVKDLTVSVLVPASGKRNSISKFNFKSFIKESKLTDISPTKLIETVTLRSSSSKKRQSKYTQLILSLAIENKQPISYLTTNEKKVIENIDYLKYLTKENFSHENLESLKLDIKAYEIEFNKNKSELLQNSCKNDLFIIFYLVKGYEHLVDFDQFKSDMQFSKNIRESFDFNKMETGKINVDRIIYKFN